MSLPAARQTIAPQVDRMHAQDDGFDVNADLQRLVSALDERVPRDGSWVRFSQHGGGPDESKITGNRQGYQRLGIEFIKATLTEPSAESIDVDLNYLVDGESDILFDWFELSDDPGRSEPDSTWPDWPIQIGCLALFLFGATAFLLGVATMVRWFIN